MEFKETPKNHHFLFFVRMLCETAHTPLRHTNVYLKYIEQSHKTNDDRRRASENRIKAQRVKIQTSGVRKSLRARNEGCAVSFIAAFPAVYRDSLANGKQHNGVHEWNKEPPTRRGQVSPYRPRNVVHGRRGRSDKETAAAAWKGSTSARNTKRPRVAVIVR